MQFKTWECSSRPEDWFVPSYSFSEVCNAICHFALQFKEKKNEH